MARCKFCGQEIEWITSLEGKQVPVAFAPHRRTCPWADKPARRRMERGWKLWLKSCR